jgi:hypothetical protein
MSGWPHGRMYPARRVRIGPRRNPGPDFFCSPRFYGSDGNSRFRNLIVAAKLTLIGASAGAYLWDGVPRSLG